MNRTPVLLLAAVLAAGAACGGGSRATRTQAGNAVAASPAIDPGDGGRYAPEIDPAGFVDVVDNPYMPLRPGSKWVYEGNSDGEPERIEVLVTGQRRPIMGISAVVVRDTVHVDGKMVEDTYDWFAQDGAGNVWYLGEDSNEYEDGRLVSRDGSWEYGVDGALPGIIMPGRPAVGDAYRQEFLRGEAEGMAKVLDVDASMAIGLGGYDGVVVTEEWNPLEPEVRETKSYAPGVGKIYGKYTRGGSDQVELVEYTPGT